ncbi:hypothetical protein GEMRC1_001163 [Eukaryota sp. GEM-RC1]
MTPKYAAPEQFDSDPSHASDIYSLGIVLYELLTGKEAFEGYPMMQIFGAKMKGKSLPFDKSTPTCLMELIRRCMSPDPLLRPKINEIIEILNNINVLEAVGEHFRQAPLQPTYEEVFSLALQLNQDISRLHEENVYLKGENSKHAQHNQNLKLMFPRKRRLFKSRNI